MKFLVAKVGELSNQTRPNNKAQSTTKIRFLKTRKIWKVAAPPQNYENFGNTQCGKIRILLSIVTLFMNQQGIIFAKVDYTTFLIKIVKALEQVVNFRDFHTVFVVETKKNCKQKHCFGGKKKKVSIFLSWEVLKFSNLPLLDSSVISGVQCKRYKKRYIYTTAGISEADMP